MLFVGLLSTLSPSRNSQNLFWYHSWSLQGHATGPIPLRPVLWGALPDPLLRKGSRAAWRCSANLLPGRGPGAGAGC